MRHPLEEKYCLDGYALLEALARRFRARVALEGAVAEVQMERRIKALGNELVTAYSVHDRDGYPDFSIEVRGVARPLLAECKNVRDSDEAYRESGSVVAYKVETQKTRAARGDPTSRYYGVDQFDLLGVCLGKKTGRWTDFAFIRTRDLGVHPYVPGKLAVMQRVPLLDARDPKPWSFDLREILLLLEAEAKGEE